MKEFIEYFIKIGIVGIFIYAILSLSLNFSLYIYFLIPVQSLGALEPNLFMIVELIVWIQFAIYTNSQALSLIKNYVITQNKEFTILKKIIIIIFPISVFLLVIFLTTPTIQYRIFSLFIPVYIFRIIYFLSIMLYISVYINKKLKPEILKKFKNEFEEIQRILGLINRSEERDIQLATQETSCFLHKTPISGLNYVCPKCGAYYCQECVITLEDTSKKCLCGSSLMERE